MIDMIDVLKVSVSSACNEIPAGVTNLVSMVISAIQIVVPILLIIWGMLDFAKAVIGSDEDKIKAAQKVFIKRLIAAVVVFLTVTIVKLVINLVGQISGEGNAQSTTIWKCVDKFISGQ